MSSPDSDVPTATNAAMLGFLKTELDIATTSVEAANMTSSIENRQLERSQARKGYNTVVEMMNGVTLSTAEAELLTNRLAVLKTALQVLGEHF